VIFPPIKILFLAYCAIRLLALIIDIVFIFLN
jgi:hypothetical protein